MKLRIGEKIAKYRKLKGYTQEQLRFWKVSNDYFSSGLFTIYSLNV